MEIASTEAQNNFGLYLKLVCYEDIIVAKNGKKAVVIKPYEENDQKAFAVAEKARAYDWEQAKISYEEFLKLTGYLPY